MYEKKSSANKYYQSMNELLNRFDTTAKKMAFTASSIDEYIIWKAALRQKLCEITGLNKMKRCEALPELIDSVEKDGYRRDEFIIQTEPNVWMPFYILIPDNIADNEKRPCIIATHGHGSGGKYAVAGVTEIPGVKEAIIRHNYDYGVKFVREGYVTFCPDARGFGERREPWMEGDETDKVMGSSCNHLNYIAISLGLSLIGMFAWDLMRLIDYIETLNFCDANRIGCAGFSGGGLQALWLSALEDRVKCTVVSGYFYGYKDALLKLPNCGCNYVPHLWEYADMGELGALIAPRALLIESGTNDHLNGERGMANVIEQINVTRKAYALFGSEDKLLHYIYHGEHRWDGGETYKFINKYI